MKCVNCGNEIPENSEICNNCKTKTSDLDEKVSSTNNDIYESQNQVNNDSDVLHQVDNNLNRVSINNVDQNKKNMNRLYKVLGVIGIIAVFAVICLFIFKNVNKDAFSILKAASNHLEKLDNYKMELSTNIKMKTEGVSSELELTINSFIDEKNNKVKTNMKVSMLGTEMETGIYMEQDGNKIITYTQDVSDKNSWTKTFSQADNSNTSVEDITKFISEIITKSTKHEIVSSDEKGLTKIKVVIDSDEIEKLVEKMELEELDIYEFKLEKDVVLYVYTDKSNQYSKIKFDLSEHVDLSKLSADATISECMLEVNFSDFNKVGDINIPKEVKENAKEITEKYFGDNDVDLILSGCEGAYTNYIMEGNATNNLKLCDFITDKSFSGSSISFVSCSNNEAIVKYNDEKYNLKLESGSNKYKIIATYDNNKTKEIELENFGLSQSNGSTVQNNNTQSNNQQATTTIDQKDAAYFNSYLEVFMSCDGENVSRNTTNFNDEDISKFVSNYVLYYGKATELSSGSYEYEMSKSEIDELVYKYFNIKSYNIKNTDEMFMNSITKVGNNYKFEWDAKGCGYTQYKNPAVTYNGVNVTVKYDLYDIMAEEYTGTSTFYLKYNNGNYNIVKIEK